MSRPKGSLPSSSSRSATPSRVSRRKVLPFFWSNRTSGSQPPSRTAITLSNMARSSMDSPTRICRPIWTSFTPISASKKLEIQRGNQNEKENHPVVVARYRAEPRVGGFRGRAGQDRQDRCALRSIRAVRRPRRSGLDLGRPNGGGRFRSDRQGLEDRYHFRRSP